ncbi:MAG: hypothetical protein H6577_03230 [Lewinellaceae bacterium]|nr:hypothetical protein [Saprospiraceae bacterium]MCB9337124.1 hypothetical protein [Lewinellaceae bacterium]
MMHQYFNKLNNRKASSLFDDLAPDTAVRLVRSDAKQSGHFNDGDLQSDNKETAKAPSLPFWLSRKKDISSHADK